MQNNSFESDQISKKSSLKLPKGFRYGSLNINELLTHIDELRLLLSDYQFDVLAINETKIDGSVSDGLIQIDGYVVERMDRNLNGGGGVAMYIGNSVH